MRKSIRPLIALTAALALTVTAGMSALAQADNNEKHFSVIEAASNEDSLTIPEIAKKCGTSVVAIETETKVVYNTYDNDYYNPFGGMFGYGFGYGYGNRGGRGGTQEYTQKAAGSGVIISEDGYILTNNHVISGADKITVYVNPGDGSEEKTYEATLIGSSESNDIAVLKIDATGLTPVVLGDSDELNVGDSVVAIGNPLGELTFSLTSGAVSALNREVTLSSNVTMDLIQTDCAINSGNSGGALFNLYGEVIGITNAKYSSSGSSGEASIDNIGFAIPINSVRSIVESIIKNGYIVKPYIGVSVEDVSSEMTSYGLPTGAVVRSVTDGAPAAQAGLQANDIITAVDGTEISGSNDLVQIVTAKKAGDTLKLSVYRQGQTLELTVTVAEQKQSAQASSSDTQQSQQQDQSQQQQQQGGGYGFPWGFGFGG